MDDVVRLMSTELRERLDRRLSQLYAPHFWPPVLDDIEAALPDVEGTGDDAVVRAVMLAQDRYQSRADGHLLAGVLREVLVVLQQREQESRERRKIDRLLAQKMVEGALRPMGPFAVAVMSPEEGAADVYTHDASWVPTEWKEGDPPPEVPASEFEP